jgi:hypothetical protein
MQKAVTEVAVAHAKFTGYVQSDLEQRNIREKNFKNDLRRHAAAILAIIGVLGAFIYGGKVAAQQVVEKVVLK